MGSIVVIRCPYCYCIFTDQLSKDIFVCQDCGQEFTFKRDT